MCPTHKGAFHTIRRCCTGTGRGARITDVLKRITRIAFTSNTSTSKAHTYAVTPAVIKIVVIVNS